MNNKSILEGAPEGAEYISEAGFLCNDDGSWFIYEQCNDEWLHMFMHEYEESTLNIRSLADITRIVVLEEIAKAVAHIGVDFGYGKYELQPEIIDKARELLSGGEL